MRLGFAAWALSWALSWACLAGTPSHGLTLLSDPFPAPALDTGTWQALSLGPASVSVSSGFLSLSLSGEDGIRKAATVFSNARFAKSGVYRLELDWRPTRARERPSMLLLRDETAPRDSLLLDLFQRHLRLELGEGFSFPMVLVAAGAGFTEELHRVSLAEPLKAYPDPAAAFHHLSLTFDFERRLLALPWMANP